MFTFTNTWRTWQWSPLLLFVAILGDQLRVTHWHLQHHRDYCQSYFFLPSTSLHKIIFKFANRLYFQNRTPLAVTLHTFAFISEFSILYLSGRKKKIFQRLMSLFYGYINDLKSFKIQMLFPYKQYRFLSPNNNVK